ncbi:MAG: efflux RND transporter periplasmic adaptor subunit [Chitinophagaceae bacterium]|nr:efflux RND transporter periplasmic adaptor subunit [Chitinophagaceae bacterium]
MRNILIISVAWIMISSCQHAETEPSSAAGFSLTDTMLASTKFSKVTLQIVQNELKLYGKISADNNKMSQVFPIVGGNVQKVNVELGDYVKQGQVLATIRSSEVAGYEKDRLDAINDLAIAEKNLQVAQDLFAGKLNSEKDVMAAQTEVEKAKNSLKKINEVFGIYNMKAGAIYNVTAPIAGFIIEKNITQNVLLNPSNLNNLFTIAQITDVWVLANVNESDIGLISQGMDASIKTISYPDRIFTGKVDRIFNILDPETKSMKVRIQIPNSDLALKPEMSATVTLRYAEKNQMIAVPSSAIVFDKSKNWVMVYHDRNDIETRLVEIYKQVGDTTYIKDGLKEGETVITQNQLLIYDALND